MSFITFENNAYAWRYLLKIPSGTQTLHQCLFFITLCESEHFFVMWVYL